jgi:hypothetical protein
VRSASTRDETNFAFRNLPKRFDHELLLSCPYSGLQIVEGIAPVHRHPALTHDGAGVVVSIHQMNRNTRFRLARLSATYSARSAMTGSTRVARRVGT